MRYQTLQGHKTTATDPGRGLWYSAACSYWTDDWSKLALLPTDFGGGIPACPHCKSVGFQSVARGWFGGARAYEKSKPQFAGYVEFITRLKETCHGRGRTVVSIWAAEVGSKS